MGTLGYRIRQIREIRNLTQEFMADRLSISQNTYSRLENETIKLSAERLFQIAEILEVPVDFLIDKEKPFINIGNNKENKYVGYFENLKEEPNSGYEKTIQILEEQIKVLIKENGQLLDIIKALSSR